MSLFREVGRRIERLKRQVEDAAEEEDRECDECGVRVDADAEECPECGAPLTGA